MDRTLSTQAKFESSNLGLILGTQIPPRGWIFWTIIFYHQKKSGQDLSNEGSNFILSSLEVAQTWPFFDKLPEITGFGLGYCQCQN